MTTSDSTTAAKADVAPDDPAALTETDVTFQGPAGQLAGKIISPKTPRISVQIVAATGVPAAYYLPFARWLAVEEMAAVLIWNYRDFSDRPNVQVAKASEATMADWGVHDAQAARVWLKTRYPQLPLWVIGHSLGGMALPFQSQLKDVARVITVCSGPVHWRQYTWPMKAKAWALWYVLGPISCLLLRYLPGQKLGLGSPLPAGVFWQWRRWCTGKESCLSDPDMPPLHTHELKAPVTLIAVSDDDMMPTKSVWGLGAWYGQNQITKRLISPKNHKLGNIGHIALFASRNQAAWARIIAPNDET